MADRIGQQLGNYRLIHLLGEGGFAEVYLGEHVHLDTQAAIKVLHTQLTSDDMAKLRTEARTIARLIHPHIVRILEFGVEGKTPFLVMDYAPEGTMRHRYPLGTCLPLVTVVSLVSQVAAALQYAHSHNVIHRDVKPENLLVGQRDEVLLSDFGLAVLTPLPERLSTQTMAGTLPYMAPEQLQGHPSFASDQYSLAIVAYEWITGKRPFTGSLWQLIQQQLYAAPPSLGAHNPAVPEAVGAVVLGALAKDPRERYVSVQGFAHALLRASQEALQAHIEDSQATAPLSLAASPGAFPTSSPQQDQPTQPPASLAHPPVRPDTVMPLQRLRQERERRGWSRSYVAEQVEVDIATVERWERGERMPQPHYRQKLCVLFEQNAQDLGCLSEVSELSDSSAVSEVPEASEAPSSLSERTKVWGRALIVSPISATRWGVGRLRMPTTRPTKGGRKNGGLPSLRQTARCLVAVPEPALPGSPTDEQRRQVPSQLLCHRRTLLIGLGGLGAMVLMGSAWQLFSHLSPPISSPTPPPSSTLTSPSVLQGTTLYTYRGHHGNVEAAAWSPESKRIVTASADKTAQVWDAADGGNIFTYRGHINVVANVAWSPDGTRIASSSKDETVQVWDATNGGHLLTYKGHSHAVADAVWSPDGKRIASCSEDTTVQIWDETNGALIFKLTGHNSKVWSLAWSPDGKRIASASADATAKVWDAITGGNIFTYKGHSGAVNTVVWSPDGARIASSSTDQTVQIWDAATGEHSYTYYGHSGIVWSLAWSPNGQRLASAGADHTVQVWDAFDGRYPYTYRGHRLEVYFLAWSPDGTRIISGGADTAVRIWQAT